MHKLLGGKILSIVNLNASSNILGINFFKIVEDNYIQGFVLIYISHKLNLESIIKSYPKI